MMTHLANGLTHVPKEGMCDIASSFWVAPRFNSTADRFEQVCMMYACHNLGKTVKVPGKYTP